MTNERKTALLKAICDAVIAGVRAAGPAGMPGGPLYAELMTVGATLEQYNAIMTGLVTAGVLRKSGELYFIAEGK